MSQTSSQKINHPKTIINYIATIISLTIMLYLAGTWGLVVIYANQIINFSKENIPFYVELKDDANEAMVFAFQKKLQASAYSKPKSVEYLSKDDALKELGVDGGLKEEDVLLFGDNLLPNMIRFSLRNSHFSEYEQIVKEIKAEEFVEHVFFTEAPAKNLADRLYRIEIILLVLMIFLIFVVITLIKNSLKLMLLANKDNVQTMQLVGSTWDYMSQPYIRQSLKNGFFSGIVAIACVWATRYLLENEVGMLVQYNIDTLTSILSAVLLIIGVFLSWICTRHSIHKYLTKPVEEWEL